MRGLAAEAQVLLDLQNRKAQIIHQRFKTPFAEIDFLFRSAQGRLVLLEVKSLSDWNWMGSRITAKQRARLLRARAYFENQFSQAVLICAAYVIAEKVIYLAIEEN